MEHMMKMPKGMTSTMNKALGYGKRKGGKSRGGKKRK